MNAKEIIKQNISLLSPQETQVANFLLENINDLDELGIKNISKKLKIQEGVISKTLSKLGLKGFKNFKQLVKESYYFQVEQEKDSQILENFAQRLHNDLDKSLKAIEITSIKKIVQTIVEAKPKIILFATGKTKIFVETFYFSLIELGYRVEIYSSLYDLKAFDVKEKIVFLFSISGKNSKVCRYLHLINDKKPLEIIGVSSSQNFTDKEFLTTHLHGEITSFFTENSRAFPFVEKYSLLLILDLFLFYILNKSEINYSKLAKISTKNIV